MKIAPKAIEGYIVKPDAGHRAALLYGPDSGLARERAKRLTKTWLGENYDPFAFIEFSEKSLLEDPARLADELSAISMMAPKRIIMVSGGDKLTKIIESAEPYFNGDVFFIVCAEELSPRSSLRSWFEKSTVTASLACYHDDVRDVQNVIRKKLEDAGVNTPRDVVEYLSNQLGNDRYVTYQELEKLITFAGDEKVLTLENARALVDYNRETSFDDAVNAVADRNLQALEKTLGELLREGTQPVAYLRAMQRYFNRMYYIRAQMSQGKSAGEVISGLRPPVFYAQVPILTRHVGSWDTPALVKALRLLVAAELACKTSDIPIIPASSRRLLQVTQVR